MKSIIVNFEGVLAEDKQFQIANKFADLLQEQLSTNNSITVEFLTDHETEELFKTKTKQKEKEGELDKIKRHLTDISDYLPSNFNTLNDPEKALKIIEVLLSHETCFDKSVLATIAKINSSMRLRYKLLKDMDLLLLPTVLKSINTILNRLKQ